MEVRVHTMKATCSDCGASQFIATSDVLRFSDALICARCGASSTYGGLLDQIGEKAIRQAESSLAALKEDRSRAPKKRYASGTR